MEGYTCGSALIASERQRQIEIEGWGGAHDNGHTEGELAWAASYLAVPSDDDLHWDGKEPEWAHDLAEKHEGRRVRELAIAGALIAAEIDRLLRLGHSNE